MNGSIRKIEGKARGCRESSHRDYLWGSSDLLAVFCLRLSLKSGTCIREMGSGLLFGDLFDSLFLWHVRHDFIIQGWFII